MPADLPYVVELTGKCDPVQAFQKLAPRRHCVFLDSARRVSQLGRYSFLACEPFEVHQGKDLELLESAIEPFKFVQPIAELPPFQGGAMGLWSYDVARTLEAIPKTLFYDEFQLPTMCVGLYDVVLAFDHLADRCWLISQGFPELDPERRRLRARERADEFMRFLSEDRPTPTPTPRRSKPLSDLAPQFPTRYAGVTSNFDETSYRETVERIVEYIRAGDAFQVNFAQRLLAESTTDSVSLYLRLRDMNAAPFAGYFDLGSHQIISASPERFLRVRDGHVEARPIKGTRGRSAIPEADLFSGAELLASTKDLAENVMIVDLMRNDLSTVCTDDSVVVSKLCGLETYEFVQHLVSVVEGQLDEQHTPIDLLRSTFPGGSITGAPKVRAMEIIAELEPTARGAYCGSLGYIGFDGAMDLSILIRTITASDGWWQFPVGGGIVSNSDPSEEYEETWDKAEGMLRAIL